MSTTYISLPLQNKQHIGFRIAKGVLVNSANILFFVVVQSLFFKHVAAKQMDVVIAGKVGAIKTYVNKNPDLKDKVRDFANSGDFVKNVCNLSDNVKKNADHNEIVLWECAKPHVIAMTVAIAVSVLVIIWFQVFGGKEDSLELKDMVSLILVVLAFSTEIVFFLTIVSKYQFIGDMGLTHMIYDCTVQKLMDTINAGKTFRDICKK